ncbi:TPA: hypothetical protein ACGVAJ_004447 [Vibrio vulnificus]|nr:hypothetical protein [Vibrio vulnificus]
MKYLLKIVGFVLFLSIAGTVRAQNPDNIISDKFGDWSVRHVFDRESLEFRYSDAKVTIHLTDGNTMEFQVNRRGGDEWTSYILKGWWDKVTIKANDVEFISEQSSMHTFYGEASSELLGYISNASSPIEIELKSGKKIYYGTISPKGSSAALRWIRVIK